MNCVQFREAFLPSNGFEVDVNHNSFKSATGHRDPRPHTHPHTHTPTHTHTHTHTHTLTYKHTHTYKHTPTPKHAQIVDRLAG